MKPRLLILALTVVASTSRPTMAAQHVDGYEMTPIIGYGATQMALCVKGNEVHHDVNEGRYFIRSEIEYNERSNMSSYKIVYGYAFETKKVTLQNFTPHAQFKKDNAQDAYARLCGKFVDSVTFGMSLSFHFDGAFQGRKSLFNVDLPGNAQGLEALKYLVKIVSDDLKGTSSGFGHSVRGAVTDVEFSSKMIEMSPEAILSTAAQTIEANKSKIQPHVLTYSLSNSPKL